MRSWQGRRGDDGISGGSGLQPQSVDNTVWVHYKEVDPYGVEEEPEPEPEPEQEQEALQV